MMFHLFILDIKVAGKPIPFNCFLNRIECLGFIHGSKRWRSEDGKRLYTWDSLHGEVEVWNSQGYHLGAIDPQSEKLIKGAKKGRRIDV
jgi:hypothetical protein